MPSALCPLSFALRVALYAARCSLPFLLDWYEVPRCTASGHVQRHCFAFVQVLKEPLGILGLSASIGSFAGVVLVAQPSFLFGEGKKGFRRNCSRRRAMCASVAVAAAVEAEVETDLPRFIPVLVALGSAISAALSFLVIRTIKKEDVGVIVLWYGLVGLVSMSIVTAFTEHSPWPSEEFRLDWLMIIGIGVLGFSEWRCGSVLWLTPSFELQCVSLALLFLAWLFILPFSFSFFSYAVGQMFLNRGMQLLEAGPASMIRNCDVLFAFIFQVRL